MIYKGQFRSKDDTLYTVKITTEGITQSEQITLGGTPFVTEMNGEGDTIYKPVKYTGATVSIVTPSYLFDIYSGKAQGTKIELYKEDSIEWTGYTTPNLYNMGFTKYKETIEVECIDALSTLQYIKYNTPKKSVVTLLYIINKIIKACNAYKGFVISANTSVIPLLDELYISEQNFYDKKKDNETDEDVAWTCQDVLKEICQYLGLTAVAIKDVVYFLDYDAIKAGINDYYHYTIDNPVASKITLKHTKTITGSDYSGGNSSISMDNVYNKVVVTNELNTFDTILPDLFDTAINITADNDNTLSSSTNIDKGMYGEVVTSKTENGTDSTNTNMIAMLDRVRLGDVVNAVFVKYFDNPYYKLFKYDSNGNDITDRVKSLNYTDTKGMHGATLVKFSVKDLGVLPSSYIKGIISMGSGDYKFGSLDKWLASKEISSLSFQNYIMFLNPLNNHITNENLTKFPYLQTQITDSAALFGGDNTYLIIKGNYMFHYWDDEPYPIPENQADIKEGRYAMDAGQMNLIAKLQWGNLYWDGTEWGTINTTFKIAYLKDDDNRRADGTMFKNLKFVNTVNWRVGTNEQGYLIPLPKNGVLSGLPVITLYKPFDPNYHSSKSNDNKGQHYKHSCVFLKDFEFKAIIGDPTFSNINESDTVYTNIIDNDFVSELEEVKFKICTWDNKNPNYSSLAINNNGSMYFLDKTYNMATKQELRQEEHYIHKVYNQYHTPSIILELELRNDIQLYGLYRDTTISGKDFIVDNLNIDYKNNATSVKLIEKK